MAHKEDRYNPDICVYCSSKEYSTVTSGPPFPILACTECGLMRRGALVGYEITDDSIYAGGKDRYHQ